MRDNTVHLESDPQITRLDTPLLRIGNEHRAVSAPGWGPDCVTGPRPTVAFSLLPIRVTFAGHDPVVLAPTTLATPSGDQVYTRAPLSEHGQRTIFLTFKDDTLARLTAAIDRPDRPVAFTDSPADPAATAAACALVHAAIVGRTLTEPVLIEDAAVAIVSRAIASSHKARGQTPRPPKRSPRSLRLQRDAVNAVCANIHTHLGDPLSLDELSDVADLSPGYLSRVFPTHTGQSLSAYLLRARVAHALTRLPDYRRRLGVLARVCGFASHAHMTTTFSAIVGRPPTALLDDELHDLIAHLRQAGPN